MEITITESTHLKQLSNTSHANSMDLNLELTLVTLNYEGYF